MALEITLIVLSFVLVLIGFLGIFFPVLPSVQLSWLGILVFGYATKFSVIGLKTILIFLGLVALSTILDFLMPILGAKKYRASKFGIIGSFVGIILGVIFFGPLGVVLGPIIGAFLGETINGREPDEALKAAKGAFIGTIVNTVLKLSLVLIMLGFLTVATFKIIF